MRPDFSNVWGSTNAPFTAITDTDYKAGWVFRTGAPPRRVNFDYFQNLSDLRHEWLGEQMLLAVGHEWQDDVTYDAYAITRSPVDGRLYRSLSGSNLNNEPSVSVSDWALGVTEQETIPESLAKSGIAGSASNLKGSATGLSALVTITADAVCLKNSLNEPVVLNSVSLSPSLSASGVNGLDTGTSAANTWYYVWVIWDGTTTAGLISLSSTAPTMPSGYTHKARVGAIRSDSTGNKYPLSFVQRGNSFAYKVGASGNVLGLPLMASGIVGTVGTSTITWAPVSVSTFVPPTASRITVLLNNFSTGGLGIIYTAPNTNYAGPASANPPQGNGNGAVSLSRVDMILESSSIYLAGQSQTATHCVGWEDNL